MCRLAEKGAHHTTDIGFCWCGREWDWIKKQLRKLIVIFNITLQQRAFIMAIQIICCRESLPEVLGFVIVVTELIIPSASP